VSALDRDVRPGGRSVSDRIDLDQLDRDGVTTVEFLPSDGVAAALELVESLELPAGHAFYASPAHDWGERARGIDLRLREICDPRLRELLPDHRPFVSGFTSKGRRTGGPVTFHQDWTYTDERHLRPVFLWCPLVDTDATNGGLEVVPGSHRWATGIRPSRSVPPTEAVADRLREMSRSVELHAGQALVFDPGVLHGSGPNQDDHPRPAFTIALVPTGAELVHFHLDDAGELTGYRVDERFFTMHPYGTRPDLEPTVEPWADAVCVADLERGIERTQRPRRWWRRRS